VAEITKMIVQVDVDNYSEKTFFECASMAIEKECDIQLIVRRGEKLYSQFTITKENSVKAYHVLHLGVKSEDA